ncbi:MAG: dihydrolipoyl dehydrogenase family protein [Francisellaceae bacterium]
MVNDLNCDIAIIGGGAGGLSVAAGAAQLGVKVVLMESSKMGGDCLNAGCVPSKALLAAAKAQWQARHSEHFGIDGNSIKTNFKAAMQHVHQVINNIAEHDSVERFEKLGVQVIQDAGKFINRNTVQADDYQITAKRFVIATGSSAFVPPIEGLDSIDYLTNENIFKLNEQPSHLIVVGGGPIGCELAQAFVMLGSQVTILESFKALPKDEEDCAAIVKEQLKATGVILHEGVKVNAIVKQHDGGITVTCEQKGKALTINGSHVLVATGRRANVQGLDLEKAGINYSAKGIVVDNRLRTSNKKIFAIGDVTGGFQFTHVAGYHAGVVIKNALFRLPAKVNYQALPWVTYTEPELAHVGLLTQEAEKQGLTITITEWPFFDNDRAQTEGNTQGKIKILTDKKARILGATIVGRHAGDLILPWVMAIREGRTLRSFTDAIAPYPTLSEISKRVAGDYYTPLLFSEKTRRLVRWLLKLG